MAFYIIDTKQVPNVVVLITNDAKLADSVSRVYADQNQTTCHVVEGDPDVVEAAPIVRVPITDPAQAAAMNVLVEDKPEP